MFRITRRQTTPCYMARNLGVHWIFVILVVRSCLPSTSFSILPTFNRRLTERIVSKRFEVQEDPSRVPLAFIKSTEPLEFGKRGEPPELHRSESSTSSSTDYGINADLMETLKQSINIVSVIESYGLDKFERKSSSRATACCPFHADKSPSLSVDGDRGLFKCFGCGVGGDVFSFVRDYSKLKGEAMTYYQAIRRVQNEWGDPTIQVLSQPFRGATKSPEELEDIRFKKERILLANAAAAAYYSECLVQPNAGAVRTYVMSRGLTATTVRATGLGYAPDAYFQKGRSRLGERGEGSLVHHLQGLGFSPMEILDAGLAIQSKSLSDPTMRPFAQVEAAPKDHNSTVDVEEVTFNSLMDRFRNRLIIPILDRSGKNVVALGGRILPQPSTSSATNSFEPAKYLNSPESLVFKKGSTLFGEYQAREQVMLRQSNKSLTTPPSIVVVEGYMDVIALWNVGVKETVASMGTALSREQLSAAAKLVQPLEGRVVICLDNDAAGVAAMERLCSNGILREVAESHKVEFRVATLPEGIKDPDEYVKMATKKSTAGLQFRDEVVLAAEEWVKWFVNRTVSSYNPNAQRGRVGSFSNVFERVAEHLATSMKAADRTRTAYEVAGSLAAILARESNSTAVSDAVRSQLESDLIDSSARIANMRDSVQLRTEQSAAAKSDMSVKNVLFALTKGEGPRGIEDRSTRWTNATARESSSLEWKGSSEDEGSTPLRKSSRRRSVTKREAKSTATLRPTKASKPKPALTPHFSGFRFTNKSDSDWLMDTSSSKSLVLGKTISSPIGYSTRLQTAEKLVYFNSNEYHGVHYLTEDAMAAGYQRGSFDRDPAVIEKGIGSLLKPDTRLLALSAENGLLRTLIRHGSSRTTLKNVIDARSAVGSSVEVKWSSEAKAWLFDCLMGKTVELPPSVSDPFDLRVFLARLPTCPPQAFSTVSKDEASGQLAPMDSCSDGNGNAELDYLFSDAEDTFGAIVSEERRAEFEVQQYHSTLLWASTAMRLGALQQAMEEVVQKIGALSSSDNAEEPSAEPPQGERDALDSEFQRLAVDLRDTSRTLQSLANSAKLTSARHLHDSSSNRLEGRLSVALQTDLAARLDEHMSSLENISRPSEFERFGNGNRNRESAREALDRIERDWGQWCDDDFSWSPPIEAKRRGVRHPLVDDEIDSSIEHIIHLDVVAKGSDELELTPESATSDLPMS